MAGSLLTRIKAIRDWFAGGTARFQKGQRILLEYTAGDSRPESLPRDLATGQPWRIPAVVIYCDDKCCLTKSDRLKYCLFMAPDKRYAATLRGNFWEDDRVGLWRIYE